MRGWIERSSQYLHTYDDMIRRPFPPAPTGTDRLGTCQGPAGGGSERLGCDLLLPPRCPSARRW